MGVTAGIFLASILLKEMRYLVYIRYLWLLLTGEAKFFLAKANLSLLRMHDFISFNRHFFAFRREEALVESGLYTGILQSKFPNSKWKVTHHSLRAQCLRFIIFDDLNEK
jgi:hypothetical protein